MLLASLPLGCRPYAQCAQSASVFQTTLTGSPVADFCQHDEHLVCCCC